MDEVQKDVKDLNLNLPKQDENANLGTEHTVRNLHAENETDRSENN